MAKTIKCPNCAGPLTPLAQQPTVRCTYCGYEAKNTVYIAPQAPPPPTTQPTPEEQAERVRQTIGQVRKRGSRFLIVFALGWVVLALGIVILTRSAGRRVTELIGSRVADTSRLIRRLASDDPLREKEPEADQALRMKLAPYRSCVADHSERALDSRRRYLGWVKNSESGPTCKGTVHGLYALNPIAHCLDELGKVQGKPPALPELDQTTPTWIATLRELDPLLKELDRYYDQKDYEDDGCKKGRDRHARLMALFAKFSAADTVLDRVVEREYWALEERFLGLVEREQGKGLRALFLRSALDAHAVLPLLRPPAGAPRPTNEQLFTAIDRYAASLEALSRAVDQAGQASSNVHLLTFYQSNASEYLKALRELRKRRQSGKPYDRTERGWLASGSGWLVRGSVLRVEYYAKRLLGNLDRVRFPPPAEKP